MAAPKEYLERAPLALTQHDKEMVVALFLMDEYGDQERDPEHYVENAVEWFNRVESMMSEPHQGDCVDFPMTCTRCVLEDYARTAQKIAKALMSDATRTRSVGAEVDTEAPSTQIHEDKT